MKLYWNLLLLAGLVTLGVLAWTIAFPQSPVSARILAASPAAASPSRSDAAPTLYQYTDESGAVRFVASLEEVPAERRAGAGRIALSPERVRPAAAPPAAASPEPSVVIYTTSWCGYCRKMLRELDARGVSYENLDIERSQRARQELLDLTGSSAVPVTVFDGELIRGYDPARLGQLIARSR